MTTQKNKSLRHRLLTWLLPPLLILSILWAFTTYRIVVHFVNVAYDRALKDTALTLAGQISAKKDSILIDLPDAAQKMVEFDEVDRIYYSITDRSDHLLAGNTTLPEHEDITSQDTVRYYDDTFLNQKIRLVEYKFKNADNKLGNLSIRVAETINKRTILSNEVFFFMIVPQLFFTLIITLLVWNGVGRGILPLRRIREAIANRNHSDLSPLDESNLPMEVYEQVHVINELMHKLSIVIDSQRRFIADATHQLRTPITVLKTRSELALRLPQQNSEEINTKLIEIDQAATRLVRLATQLLNLTQAETGLGHGQRSSDFLLNPLIEEAVAALVPAALKKEIEIKLINSPDQILIHGHPHLFGEMVANLVDNAIRYSDHHSAILIEIGASQKQVHIVIEDTGPGIPPLERERVFQRFYRLSGTNSEGSGLGLAIAREIILIHHGEICLKDGTQGKGLRVELKLPRAPTAP